MDSKLVPARVFEFFAQINQIPRPSKHEERMIEYLKNFGESRGLRTVVDETGNVLISKPATPGYEDRPTVILQSHMDMVCDKLVDVDFDFSTDAIQTYIDGEWMHAKGTTLGADDGIGDAMELALLDDDTVEHGPIECVFTRDEETELTGARGIKPGFMTGSYLINLDSEDEGQIFVSCAGGHSTTARFAFAPEAAPEGYEFVEISLKGLNGGHSGDDINKKRANAIKLLARYLYKEIKAGVDLRISSFNSGKMDNAIPRDGKVVIAAPAAAIAQLKADWQAHERDAKTEFHCTDTTMQFFFNPTQAAPVVPAQVGQNLVRALQAVDNGVFAMSQEQELSWLVETSTNLSIVRTLEGCIEVVTLQRSSVNSNLENIANTVTAAFELAGATCTGADSNPAWPMKEHSQLQAIAEKTYTELFGHAPKVLGIHAGLECGLFALRYPDLDMISMGPTLRNVHTPDECLHIPTVKMVWDHLCAILKNIK